MKLIYTVIPGCLHASPGSGCEVDQTVDLSLKRILMPLQRRTHPPLLRLLSNRCPHLPSPAVCLGFASNGGFGLKQTQKR